MHYDEKTLTGMVDMGVLGYTLPKIINCLDIKDEDQFAREFNNPDSPIAKAYRKGQDKADYMVDIKLFQLATKEGDLQALKEYELRKDKRIREEKQREKEKALLTKTAPQQY